MFSLTEKDIRETLWPRRLLKVRQTLNRSSLLIMGLGLIALAANAFWIHHDWQTSSGHLDSLPASWFHPAYLNSLIIAVIIVYALRQINRTRHKLAPLGYPLLEKTETRHGRETWKSVEPLTKRSVLLHIVHAERMDGHTTHWKTLSRYWIKRCETARKMSSPHAARVVDCGFAGRDSFYAALEMPRGLCLAAMLERHGPVSIERALFLLAQVAHAVSDAHANGLSNLIIDPRHIWVGMRAMNADWVTIELFDYDDVRAQTSVGDGRREDVRNLLLLAARLIAQPEVANLRLEPEFLESVGMPRGIRQVMRALASPDAEFADWRAEEVIARIHAAYGGPPWSNDLALEWWTNHAPRAGDAA